MRPLIRPRQIPVVATFLVVASFGASCGQSRETSRSAAVAGSEVVTFPAADGVQLSGRLFGPPDASAGVVLAHMLPADQSAWYETAGHLAAQGYRVLTFDFRGYCPGGDAGCSQGEKDVNAAPVDLQGALDFLRSKGPTRVALVGASMGGTAAMLVASQEGDGVDAVITLSAPQVIDALGVGNDTLATLTAAKLYLAGTGDTTAVESANFFYNASQQPKREEILTTDDHGTDMLTGNQGARVTELMDAWLALYLPTSPASPSPQQGGAP